MFTGLIQEVGRVRRSRRRGDFRILEIAFDSAHGRLRKGDSIAVNGVCLTATAVQEGSFTADVSSETRRRSTLDGLQSGDAVNLERPVTAADPLGGHIVLGHVDGVGRIREVTPGGGGRRMKIQAPSEVTDLVVVKGSIAVDGVSLTVAAVRRQEFEVSIIPETEERTTLSVKRAGNTVNLEADYLAKLVQKFVSKEKGASRHFPGVRGED